MAGNSLPEIKCRKFCYRAPLFVTLSQIVNFVQGRPSILRVKFLQTSFLVSNLFVVVLAFFFFFFFFFFFLLLFFNFFGVKLFF